MPWDALSSDGRFVLAVAVVVKLEIPILIKRLVLLARPNCSGYFLRPPLLDDSSKTAIASDDKSTGAVEIFTRSAVLSIHLAPTHLILLLFQPINSLDKQNHGSYYSIVQQLNNWL